MRCSEEDEFTFFLEREKMSRFEKISALVLGMVVVSALTGFAGNALTVLGRDAENSSLADALTGLVTLLVASLGWFENRRVAQEARQKEKRMAEPIRFFLVATSGDRREIPLHLRRRDCNRAETLGRVGMKPLTDPKARFALAGISSAAFLVALNEVQDGRRSEVEILCTEAEMAQFNWEKME